MRNLLALAALMSLVAIYKCQQCSYEMNVDYCGTTLSTYSCSTVDQCCSSCISNSGCAAWTFDTNTKTCTLKSNMGARKYTCNSNTNKNVRKYLKCKYIVFVVILRIFGYEFGHTDNSTTIVRWIG